MQDIADVTIIDFSMSNIRSLSNAFTHNGFKVEVSKDVAAFDKAKRLVLPGVGAFKNGMIEMESLNLATCIKRFVLEEKKPFLGICLGMQLMFEQSYEDGTHSGLGLAPGSVRRLGSTDNNLRVPHIGWNNVVLNKGSILYEGIPDSSDFYFAHSYYVDTTMNEIVTSQCDYGTIFPSSFQKENLFGVQFHPEKSGKSGLKLIKNFIDYT